MKKNRKNYPIKKLHPPKKKLRLAYGAGNEIANRLNTTRQYVNYVLLRYNKGHRIVGEKSVSIIDAIRNYKWEYS
jgi:hypothetical protein